MMDFEKWGLENIIWVGSSNTNKSGRRGNKPSIIVNHISQGLKVSCIDWFTSEYNKESSAHFLVSKRGEVYQFVDIEFNAWANGVVRDPTASKVIFDTINNPNWYSVSIEHEGIYEDTKGALTKQQLESTVKLHKYIIAYVKNKLDSDIKISRESILKHSEINSVDKINCPGIEFPIQTIINRLLGVTPECDFKDIEGHWAKESILKAHKAGLIVGKTKELFYPNDAITRAEMVTILVKALDL